MAKVMFSYSHRDEVMRDELEIHLRQLKRDGLIESWHDRRITAGSEWRGEIDENLESADVILLLVSPYFIDSDYCTDVELARAMKRHEAKEALVIPVILESCDWKTAPFSKLQTATKDGRPLSKFPNIHDGFLEVALALRQILGKRTTPVAKATPQAGGEPVSRPGMRSSNLLVRKSFTDRERHRFRDDAFEFASKFFEASLAELEQRNAPTIETQFKRVDAERFTAIIYKQGKVASQCGIRLENSRFGGGILYSSDPNSSGYNENFSVADNGTSMFLTSSGMAISSSRDGEYSPQGMAEALWTMLIQPLQR